VGSDESDRDLCAAVLAGNELAFRQLYRRHTPRLRCLVARLIGYEQADVDDTVQETWVRAVRALRGFRWEAALASWLAGIAIRVARETLRHRRRWRFVSAARTESVAGPAIDLLQRLDLDVAIARLPDGYRTVFVLHDVEGLTHDEIAHLTGIAQGTSKAQLFRARQALRRELTRHDHH